MSFKKRNKDGPSSSKMETESVMDFDFKKIMKEVELVGNSRLTWKEKQALESRKVVALGGKAPKKQRVPLSVARVQMKKQKEREQKMLKNNIMISKLGGPINVASSSASTMEKRKPRERSLKCSEGHFKNGILKVSHLLKNTPSSDSHGARSASSFREPAMKKMGGKKNKGKKKGKGKGKGKGRH